MSKTYRKRRSRKLENLSLTILKNIFLVTIAAVLTILFFTHKNASAIFVDGEAIGTIKGTKVSTEEFEKLVKAKIYSDLNADIMLKSEISVVPVHTSKKQTVALDHVLANVCKTVFYLREGMVIYINGDRTLTFHNKEEADNCLNEILKDYGAERFADKVELKPEFVEGDEVLSEENAYSTLTQRIIIEKNYTVSKGDNLSNIAAKFDMTLNELYEINPTLSGTTMLRQGEEIVLNLYKPLLSVRDFNDM